MLIKTILNSIEKFKSFTYIHASFEKIGSTTSLIIKIAARVNSKGKCAKCGINCQSYDRLNQRDYQYVPLWNIPTYFRYQPRRVLCSDHGVIVERVPWASGKDRFTRSYKLFLATWAKRLSWKETANVFKTRQVYFVDKL